MVISIKAPYPDFSNEFLWQLSTQPFAKGQVFNLYFVHFIEVNSKDAMQNRFCTYNQSSKPYLRSHTTTLFLIRIFLPLHAHSSLLILLPSFLYIIGWSSPQYPLSHLPALRVQRALPRDHLRSSLSQPICKLANGHRGHRDTTFTQGGYSEISMHRGHGLPSPMAMWGDTSLSTGCQAQWEHCCISDALEEEWSKHFLPVLFFKRNDMFTRLM